MAASSERNGKVIQALKYEERTRTSTGVKQFRTSGMRIKTRNKKDLSSWGKASTNGAAEKGGNRKKPNLGKLPTK